MTQPLLLEQLQEWGVDISAGQIERIVSEGKERFHEEQAAILRVGLEVSDYLPGLVIRARMGIRPS